MPAKTMMPTERGFTLVELITVILLIGILGAFAAGRMVDRGGFDGRAYADQTASMLRYAQKVAIAQNRDVVVRLNAGGIALCYQAACGAGQRVPAAGAGNSGSATTKTVCADATWACEAPPPGVTVATSAQFYFDPVGKPISLTDTSPTAVPTYAPLTVQITYGTLARSIVIEHETGYVH